MKFKLGDIVKSKWNNYNRDLSYVVDRVYQRKDGTNMLRLHFEGDEKRINVPEHYCELDISYMRNEKLNKLLD